MGRTVKYSVTRSEPWAKVAPFFTSYPEAMEQLLAAVTERDEAFAFDLLTVRGMLEAVGGAIPTEVKTQLDGMTVGEAAARLNSLRDGLMAFAAFMEDTAAPETLRQKAMRRGMKEGNIEEAVMWTLKECFTLHGFEDAQKLTVYEYKTARKNAYNEALAVYRQSVEMETAMASRRR